MDSTVWLLAIITVTLMAVSFHAWRIGNEQREVALLGVIGGLCGVGTGLAVLL